MINISLSGANVFLTSDRWSTQLRFGIDEPRLMDMDFSNPNSMDEALQQVQDNYTLASKAFELIKNSSELQSKLIAICYTRYTSIEDMLYECSKGIS